ncbi:hypothetical protein J7X40_004178 [Vibrio parahaemolyticus]|uniref:hypothetical protein n=1 Tax=Vibrio harveyi group TaxID=717610 RepID=UPI00112060DA|nr:MULTISPECIES: hypothetical protein [Vibrio harveyi group]EKL0031220.1 hypothetical protein [Vibrio vulnificus]EHH2534677.1 hypothetical protein [Vibrio parahaemolyticus]EHZ2539960.1 hypothetical protein [Vibrio parahaemolyticus]MBY4648740.1 hypothetical protein [Vibrio alginolyticus]TOF35082.1 hypothetical protein CGJ28_21250 [Vibrio parahaemolyticus]
MSKIEVRFSNIQKNEYESYEALVWASVESDTIKWEGELTVQLVDGEFDCYCQIYSCDISHDDCLRDNYRDTDELGIFDEELMTRFFEEVVAEAEQGFSEECTLDALLEESCGLKLNESSTSAAGCGIAGGFHLEKYTEADGDKVLLVAIDSKANGDRMINRTKVFDSEEEYDEYVEDCSEMNGRQLCWNDGNFALQMYIKMVDCEYDEDVEDCSEMNWRQLF